MKYTRQPAYDIISIVRIRYYTETVIQIFKTYTETRIRCYIGIISRILADSYRVKKGNTRQLFKKYTEKFCSVSNRILSEYGRIRCEKTPCSRWFCVVKMLRLYNKTMIWNFSYSYMIIWNQIRSYKRTKFDWTLDNIRTEKISRFFE